MLSSARTRGLNVLSTPQHLIASTSRPSHQRSIWNPASLNPLPWFQAKVAPKKRLDERSTELSKAITELSKRSDGNIFDTEGSELSKPSNELKRTVEEKLRQDGIKFGPVPKVMEPLEKHDHHYHQTDPWKVSPRKLNLLARQIGGKPIDYAILQMRFSQKRASKYVQTALEAAKDVAIREKRLDPDRLIVAESWVMKGVFHRRVDIKGRGRMGIKHHPSARIGILLKEGKTYKEKMEAERIRKLGKIRSAGLVREDRPLRNDAPIWAW